MVAEELLLMVPAIAVNVPVVAPLMLTLAGTCSSPLLLLRFTVAVPEGAPLNVTVQVVVCPVPSAPAPQLTEDNCTDTRLKLKVFDTPFAAAVSIAVWFELTEDTVAVKPAVAAPAPTITFAGTVALALLLDSVTTWPPPGATLLSVTVHAEVPGAFTLAGEHESALGTGGG